MIEEKELILEEIANELKNARGVIVTSFRSINANQFADLRKAMYLAQSGCVVMKKRILKKAIDRASEKTLEVDIDSHALFIYAHENFIETTKAFVGYQKKNPDLVSLVGGYFEDRFCSPEDVKMISELPTLDEARSAVIGLLEAPLSNMLAVLEAALTGPMFCVQNKSEKESTT